MSLRRSVLATFVLFPLVSQLSTSPAQAQSGGGSAPLARPASAAPTTSVMLGGFAISRSRLLLAKVGREHRHWGFGVDVTRDAVQEPRPAGAEDDYELWAGSVALRYYAKPGRGLWGEAAVGYAALRLEARDSTRASSTVRDGLPMASWGVGYRLGRRAGGPFAEVGLRNALALAERHLYPGAQPPEGSRDEPLSQHSWFFERGATSSQIHVGVGISF